MGLLNKIKGEEPLFRIGTMLVNGEDLSKGNTGEYLIDYALAHGGIEGRKKLFRNLLVPRKGVIDTSEIDCLMLHERGIYVFESKNCSGWIFGSADQRQWIMNLNKATKERFYNPIKQNQGHINALAEALGLPPEVFVSFIVFSERCELKKVPDNTEGMVICRRHHLVRDVKRSLDKRTFKFEDEQLKDAYRKLKALAEGSTDAAKSEYVEQARAVAAGKVCPYCGSELVERRRKSDGGTFIGCSAFPSADTPATSGKASVSHRWGS